MSGGFDFQWHVMWESLPVLLQGAKLTLLIAVSGLLLGFLAGSLIGLAKTARKTFLCKPAGGYIAVVRGTPLMVQVLFLYFGLPVLLGMSIPPLTAGIIAIAVNSAAYIAEVVRGAIESIDKGQVEAARSMGLTRCQALLYVVWPQAFRRMIPPLGNQFIISIKDTSLLVVIGVGELTRQGQVIASVNFRAFEVWLTVALIYLAMTLSLSKILEMAERRMRII